MEELVDVCSEQGDNSKPNKRLPKEVNDSLGRGWDFLLFYCLDKDIQKISLLSGDINSLGSGNSTPIIELLPQSLSFFQYF